MKRLILAATAIGLLNACSSGDEGLIAKALKTEVDPSQLLVGESAEVLCLADEEALPKDGVEIDIVSVEGDEAGLQYRDGELHALSPGDYSVHCLYMDLRDEGGATVSVRDLPAKRVYPDFSTNPTEAGVPSELRCLREDARGDIHQVKRPRWDLPPGLVFSSQSVVAEAAGSYPIKCLDPDEDEAISETGIWVVIPSAPVSVVLSVQPERAVYRLNAQVEFSWLGQDRFGNLIEGLPGRMLPPNNLSWTQLDSRGRLFSLDAEGWYHFQMQLDAPYDVFQDSMDLLVDESPPEIILDSPLRGATLDASKGPVLAEGRVFDLAGPVSLTINGETIPTDERGYFSSEIPSVWGVNVLHIQAEDAAGYVTTLSPSYAYADAWSSFQEQDAKGLQNPDAISLLLGQNFFDDGVHDPSDINDLATLIEILLSSIDLSESIGSLFSGFEQRIPVFNSSDRYDIVEGQSWVNYELDGDLVVSFEGIENFDTGASRVDLRSKEGGLDLDFSVGSENDPALGLNLRVRLALEVAITTEGCSPLACLPPQDSVALGESIIKPAFSMGTFVISIKSDISKAPFEALHYEITDLQSSFGDFQVAPFQDVEFHIEIDAVPGLIPPIELDLPLSSLIDLDALTSGLIGPLLDAAGESLPGMINPLVMEVLNPLVPSLFDMLVLDTTLPLPNLLGGEELQLGLYTEIATVDFGLEGGHIGISTGLYSEKGLDMAGLGYPGDLHEEHPLGAILRNDCLMEASDGLSWDFDPSLTLGLKTDLINAFFYAVWQSGVIHTTVDLSALAGDGGGGLPLDGMALDLSWLLPPVLNDCSGEGLDVQVGDLYIVFRGDIMGMPIEAGFYLDATLGLSFVTSEEAEEGEVESVEGLSIRIDGLSESDIELQYLEDGGLGALFNLESLILGLPELISESIAGQIIGPIALPATELSELIPGLPEGTSVGIKNLQGMTEGGFILFGGELTSGN